jgi:hypothetical protein
MNDQPDAAESATEIGADVPPRIPRARRSVSLWPVVVYLVLVPAVILLFNWLLGVLR